jgi:hypothetical protein
MIKFLADFFRGLSMIMGVSLPEGKSDKAFVTMWVGILAAVVVGAAALLSVILFVIFPYTARPH